MPKKVPNLKHDNKRSPLRQGIIDGAIFFPILAPFSVLFGVFAADLDLTIVQTMSISLGVFAGTSQFASLSLLNENAPIYIALLAGFTLNMRFFLYSANLAPHFQSLPTARRVLCALMIIDQSFVLTDNRFGKEPRWNAWQKSQYFLGTLVLIAVPWHLFTILGFYTGGLIPENINIAYALPLSFIALIMPALKTPAHWLAAIISITGTLALRDLPYNIGLLISAFFAIVAAGQLEIWQRRWQK